MSSMAFFDYAGRRRLRRRVDSLDETSVVRWVLGCALTVCHATSIVDAKPYLAPSAWLSDPLARLEEKLDECTSVLGIERTAISIGG